MYKDPLVKHNILSVKEAEQLFPSLEELILFHSEERREGGREGGRVGGRESGRRGKEGVTEEERGNNYVMKKQSEKIGEKGGREHQAN